MMRPWIAALAVVVCAASCGSNADVSTADRPSGETTETTAETVAPTTPPVELDTTLPVVGDGGDTADVTFLVREPEHLSDTDMPMPDACGDWTADYAGINDRALIIPVDVKVVVTSSLPAEVSLRFAYTGEPDKL